MAVETVDHKKLFRVYQPSKNQIHCFSTYNLGLSMICCIIIYHLGPSTAPTNNYHFPITYKYWISLFLCFLEAHYCRRTIIHLSEAQWIGMVKKDVVSYTHEMITYQNSNISHSASLLLVLFPSMLFSHAICTNIVIYMTGGSLENKNFA